MVDLVVALALVIVIFMALASGWKESEGLTWFEVFGRLGAFLAVVVANQATSDPEFQRNLAWLVVVLGLLAVVGLVSAAMRMFRLPRGSGSSHDGHAGSLSVSTSWTLQASPRMPLDRAPAPSLEPRAGDLGEAVLLGLVRELAKAAFAACQSGTWTPLRSVMSPRAEEDFRACARGLGRVTGLIDDRVVLLALDAADPSALRARVLLEAAAQTADTERPRPVRQEWSLERKPEGAWSVVRVQALPAALDAAPAVG